LEGHSFPDSVPCDDNSRVHALALELAVQIWNRCTESDAIAADGSGIRAVQPPGVQGQRWAGTRFAKESTYSPRITVFLAAITGALLRWLLLAVLALRRIRRLPPHPVLFAKIHIDFRPST
jgi:hypothetical protein